MNETNAKLRGEEKSEEERRAREKLSKTLLKMKQSDGPSPAKQGGNQRGRIKLRQCHVSVKSLPPVKICTKYELDRKMNEEDTSRGSGYHSQQATKILKALSHFEYPTNVSEVPVWLDQVQPIQSLIKTLCKCDRTGKTTLRCVFVLYDLIADDGVTVSPAVWNLLELIDEDKLMSLAKRFAKDSSLRLKNALCALVEATCQCGHRIPQLGTWCRAFITSLESSQKHCVLLSMSQCMMPKLFCSLLVPHARKIIYPFVEKILCQIQYPNVFNEIVDQVPEVIASLYKDDQTEDDTATIRDNFCGLVRVLLKRFPATSPTKEETYLKIREALQGLPETDFHPCFCDQPWNQNGKTTPQIANILECPVCYERFIAPILVCENGHCICSNCKDQLKTCPICRAQFSSIRMTIIEQILEATEFQCKNSGCGVKLLYKDIGTHELNCEYRTISCDIVTFHNVSSLVCNEDVVLYNFHRHMEKCHESFVSDFELNVHRKGELRKQKLNEVRLLKNSADDLYFVERIFMTDEEILFSYHYIGKNADANNYMYTIKIQGENVLQRFEYSNLCLSNYKGIYDTEMDRRCLILEPEWIFNPEQTKVYYSVKIEDVNSCRWR